MVNFFRKTSLIKRNRNKKAQVPTTLTWFIGFLIIFFVMLMFIFFTLLASRSREIHVQPMEGSSEDLEIQRDLIVFLDSPVEVEEEKISIKELIRRWDVSESKEKKKLESILKQELDGMFPQYYFTIHRNDPGVFLELENNPDKVSIVSDYRYSLAYVGSDKGVLRASLSFSKYEGIWI